MNETKHYMLTVYQRDTPPPPGLMERVMPAVSAFNEELRDAGAWVFGAGLHSPSSATVVRERDGELLVTDGPYAEAKEHVGGFVVISAPDLDAALAWARKAARATTLPVEVRPVREAS
jgi:hypothetical protein